MSKAITVVVAYPGERAACITIDGSLAALQTLVGGFIEAVRLHELGGATVYVNEDGFARGLRVNLDRMPLPIVGPIVVSRADAEGEEIGLAPEITAGVARALDRLRGL